METIGCLSEDSEDCTTIANKTDESETQIADGDLKSKSEQDFQSLRTKLCLLESSLEEQRVTCNYLREERNETLTLNRLLKREIEELRRGIHKGTTRPSPEPRQNEQSRNYNTGMAHGVICCLMSMHRCFFVYLICIEKVEVEACVLKGLGHDIF